MDDQSSNSSLKSEKQCKECTCLRTVSNGIIHGLEVAFFTIGRGIGLYPWVTLLCCVLLTVAFIPGLALFFYQEDNQEKLWVPLGSQSLTDKLFVDEHFSSNNRFQTMLITDANVLTPTVIQAMLDLDIEVKNIVSQPSGLTWDDLCARLGPKCWSNSLLELWSFDEAVIRALTQQQILNMINTATSSPVYGTEYNASQALGGITRDPATGDITGAEATNMQWFLLPNGTFSDDYLGTVDDVLNWEEQFLNIAENGRPDVKEIFYVAGRSFTDEAGGAITGDVLFLSIGYVLVIIFIAIVLGRFTRIRHRIYVSFAGVICIGLAIICSFGLCSYAGLFYGPVHSVLPFLLLGIGVDDMFVICQSLDRLGPEMDDLPIHDRIGHTLKHAGVSITVTSLTDILAFAVGSSTIIPALRSFCAYAAVGVFFTFLFQATFLVACLTYDDKRVRLERNACCCCITHKDDVPNSCSNTLVVQTIFDKFYAPLMVKLPTKIIVVIVAAALLGVNIWGVVSLEQDFDPAWFLPSDTYPRKYSEAFDKYFPSSGATGAVYFGDINYFTELNTLQAMYVDVRNDPYVSSSTVDSWFYSFKEWMDNNGNNPTNEDQFYDFLLTYLAPPSDGARFVLDLDLITTADPSGYRIAASKMPFQHINVQGASNEIKVMESIQAVVASYNYPPEENFVYSVAYLNSETNKVIQKELFRNLGFAFLCVFIMTLILLADIPACLIVCVCVIMSLVDVGGIMHFWGLTIDTVTSINLIVAIGLTVDYSAHIAHTFLTTTGTRNDRVEKTLSGIGPPVFYGGFSTFLAFVTVAASQSYVFATFFKIFLLVVLFGLFHGLMFLPVILSWMGPRAYSSAQSETDDDSNKQVISAYENGGFGNGDVQLNISKNKGPSYNQHSSDGFANGTPIYQEKDLKAYSTNNPNTKHAEQNNGDGDFHENVQVEMAQNSSKPYVYSVSDEPEYQSAYL